MSGWQVVNWARTRAQSLSDAYVKERSEPGEPPTLVLVSSAARRAVLRCLADHADNDTGECYPGMRCIATETGLSLRTVVRAIRTLRDDRLVERRRGAGPNRCNLYRLRFQHVEVP